jgi:hypothetical protein
MAQADSVLSTPPTNTSVTRRKILGTAAGAAAALAATGTVPAAIPTSAAAAGLANPPSGFHKVIGPDGRLWFAADDPDAELIELGARFEPLLDRYYAGHNLWSVALAQAHAERDREFGTPAEWNYEYTPEINAAFEDSCKRLGYREAADALSAIHEEMQPLTKAINAATVCSIEGLRAKALVAFWEVAPLAAGDTEFHFVDAYPFQRLFTAVAEFCGLKDKMAATGYELPDIPIFDDDPDDDSDDEGEEA